MRRIMLIGVINTYFHFGPVTSPDALVEKIHGTGLEPGVHVIIRKVHHENFLEHIRNGKRPVQSSSGKADSHTTIGAPAKEPLKPVPRRRNFFFQLVDYGKGVSIKPYDDVSWMDSHVVDTSAPP